jgi:hypothetical protein
MWQPEIFPTQYAIPTITRPKAKAVRIYPLPAAALQPTSIAVPQPRITRTIVPINSAIYFLIESIINLLKNDFIIIF